MSNQFIRYELRTTDVDAARAFYDELLGSRFLKDSIDVAPLPKQAAARGAPPHWLGHVGVDDVVGTVLRFVSHGATQLGPALIRDPSGALVAFSENAPITPDDRVAWHVLHSRDEARALSIYCDLFDWTPLEFMDLGPQRGRLQLFSWDKSSTAHGATSDAARRPHVHPQWLFFFRTPDLRRSLATVRTLGGLALEATETPDGDLVAPCDDPQGAAFALFQARA
jgi:uncharacterized protein